MVYLLPRWTNMLETDNDSYFSGGRWVNKVLRTTLIVNHWVSMYFFAAKEVDLVSPKNRLTKSLPLPPRRWNILLLTCLSQVVCGPLWRALVPFSTFLLKEERMGKQRAKQGARGNHIRGVA